MCALGGSDVSTQSGPQGKWAPFLIISILDIGTIFTEDKPGTCFHIDASDSLL